MGTFEILNFSTFIFSCNATILSWFIEEELCSLSNICFVSVIYCLFFLSKMLLLVSFSLRHLYKKRDKIKFKHIMLYMLNLM